MCQEGYLGNGVHPAGVIGREAQVLGGDADVHAGRLQPHSFADAYRQLGPPLHGHLQVKVQGKLTLRWRQAGCDRPSKNGRAPQVQGQGMPGGAPRKVM